MKKYLVTGGLGFLGAGLVKALLRAGHAVRILDNSSRGSVEKLGDFLSQTELMVGDIRDPKVAQRAVEGVDSVCHLAFVNGTEHFYKRPAYVLDVGVKGMVNILDACVRSNVRELITASSSEVYQTPPVVPTPETVPLSIPDPSNPRYSYAGGKIISELMAINYGREFLDRSVIFRPHNVFGPDMGWEHVIPQFVVRMQQRRKETGSDQFDFEIQGTGNQSRAFVYVDDFIEALMLVIEQGKHCEIYHLGTDQEITIGEVAHKVARSLGVTIKLVPGAEAVGGTPRRCPDISRIRALGFKPKWILDEAINETVRWYRDRQPSTGAAAQSVLTAEIDGK
jgi:nucleoside-diphosphate-sugar epimerase